MPLDDIIHEDDYSLHLPNIRSLFQPDPGYALVEGDLRGADAFVAAWDADATDLKEALLHGTDLHTSNAELLFGSVFEGRRIRKVRDISPHTMHVNGMSYRDNAKRWVHATDFNGRARTVASVLALREDHVESCQTWWKEERHPQIGAWHRRTDHDLRSRKMPIIHNAFGFRRVYVGGAAYGRSDNNLLGQALGWICQSTVAIVISKAVENIDCNFDLIGQPRCGSCLVCRGDPWQLLLQIHDSELMQIRQDALNNTIIDRLRSAMDILVPYDDPLHIPVEIKHSAENWGVMRKWQ